MSTPGPDRDPDLPGWDDATRPVSQAYADATAAQRSQGDHLRRIHDMYRAHLSQVGDVLGRVAAGELGVEAVRGVVHDGAMRATYERLGSFCGQLCRGIEAHHRIEDAHLYPALRAADEAGLGAVLGRLYDEHEVVHEMLVRLDATLVAMGGDPSLLGRARRQFDHLHALLLSHFAYEEDQIADALGVHRVMI